MVLKCDGVYVFVIILVNVDGVGYWFSEFFEGGL